jgi:hypothetical protein
VGAVLWPCASVVGGVLRHSWFRRGCAVCVRPCWREQQSSSARSQCAGPKAATHDRHEGELSALRARMAMQAEHHAQQLSAAEGRITVVRGDREQLRNDMKAISADVLRQTGATVSREIAAQRSVDQERAAGELDSHGHAARAVAGSRRPARRIVSRPWAASRWSVLRCEPRPSPDAQRCRRWLGAGICGRAAPWLSTSAAWAAC